MEKGKVFISYKSEDAEYVHRIKTELERFGLSIWIDEKDILGGDDIFDKIVQGLNECKVIISVLSHRSIKSNWVKTELNRALHYEVTKESCFVIPVRIEECDIPEAVTTKKVIDLYEDFDYYMRKIVEQIDEQMGIEWTYPETAQYAEENLIYNLKQNRNYSSLAIDNGLAFYYTTDYTLISTKDIEIKIPDWAKDILSKDLKDPTKEELQRCIPHQFAEASDYLRTRLVEGLSGFFNCKVGIVKIEKPIKRRFEIPLTLTVIPLNYWVVKEFNRRMLRAPQDEILQALRTKNLNELTKATSDVDFNCPSALYVELVILTADNQVCVVEKNPQLSVLAHSSRSKWTATIEEGFEWNKDIDQQNNRLKIESVIARCFHLELDIFKQYVHDVKLAGIALEYTHLNTALIGVCALSLNSGDVAKKIKLSEDFQLKYKFTSVDTIEEDYFEGKADDVTWHPTARLRLLAAKQYIESLREV